MNCNIDNLRIKSQELRKNIFTAIYKAGGGHIAPAFSCTEILSVLYFGGVLKYNAEKPDWEDRDRFILSKGHASAALFSILAMAGYFDIRLLDTFCKKGSILGGHPNMLSTPGVEASTGALGHGLLFATGVALAAKMNNKSYHTYVMLGDGECQEGSVWEGALFAAQNKLNNLTAILDYNKFQAMDRLTEIINMEPMGDKWRSFGWNIVEIDGHDISQIIDAFKCNNNNENPTIIIAHTVKGKGVSFMENKPLWHCRITNQEETEIVMTELGVSIEELNER